MTTKVFKLPRIRPDFTDMIKELLRNLCSVITPDLVIGPKMYTLLSKDRSQINARPKRSVQLTFNGGLPLCNVPIEDAQQATKLISNFPNVVFQKWRVNLDSRTPRLVKRGNGPWPQKISLPRISYRLGWPQGPRRSNVRREIGDFRTVSS